MAHTMKTLIHILFLLAATLSPQLAHADIAGTAELVSGTVWIQGGDNKMRPIKTDDALHEGDIIMTGKDGELQARMQDDAIIAVRPNSKLKIEIYRARGDEEDSAVFNLIIGTFRSVTGWIGKYNRKNYTIHTSTATIGVRGTDHEPMYIPPPVPGMKPIGEPGVYDKVNDGRIVIRNQFGETEFDRGQVGFIGLDSRGKAVQLNGVPDFFKRSRHEQRIEETKQKLHPGLEQRLMKQQQRMQGPAQQQASGHKPVPRLLNPQRQPGGFVPDLRPSTDTRPQPVLSENDKPQPVRPLIQPPQPLKSMPAGSLRPMSVEPMNRPTPTPVHKPLPAGTPIIPPRPESGLPLKPEPTIRPDASRTLPAPTATQPVLSAPVKPLTPVSPTPGLTNPASTQDSKDDEKPEPTQQLINPLPSRLIQPQLLPAR